MVKFWLTYIHLPGLSAIKTNRQHLRQPLVLTNLVADESLTGKGAWFSYFIPTGSELFAQVDLGTWSGAEDSGDTVNVPDTMVGLLG